MYIYSVYDKKTGKYGPLMSLASDVECIRAVEMDLMRSGSVISQYPHDFCVHKLGAFDTETGVVCPETVLNIYECSNILNIEK